jgi:biotin carboxylase
MVKNKIQSKFLNQIMKKLLILGANPETIPLIETAKSMGIYTIVTDPDPQAPSKKFADKGIDINGIDIDKLVEFGKKEKIDGVLVGVADRLIEPYQKVAEALNLPCYGNKYQCEILTNKKKFNNLCKEYDILPIPSITFYKDSTNDVLKDISYPVFIKPVDGNSGKGMSIVYEEHKLNEGIKKAFANTKSNHILIEKYMRCKDILVSYTILNGEPILSAMADRYTSKEQGETSQVCLGAIYPSSLLTTYMVKEHPKVVNMLKGIKLQNAILTISAFIEDDNFYYYDPGFRLQGEAPNLHMERINGFDQKKFLLDISLDNKFDGINITEAHFNNHYSSTIWFLLKKGTISKIEGFEQIKNDPSVFHISKRLSEGDTIDDKLIGTEGQVLARIYICCKTQQELKNKISKFQNVVKVFDTNNNNQLLNGFIYE